jgi:signal transduction histidine kinase
MSTLAPAKTSPAKVPFRLHPRVFASLGTELVTNDVVAIIELVKNSYDALAKRVDVRFVQDTEKGMHIEIEDDGTGMTRSIIKNVWCVVATPFRLNQPVSRKGKRKRRVSGEKGLGRLSAARLGKRLELITKSAKEPCWQVNVKWDDLSKANSLNFCNVELQKCKDDNRLDSEGTIVRILDLRSEWNDSRMQDLREQLSRLVSPFTEVKDFEIYLTLPEEEEAEPVEIKPPDFLSKPPYMVKGHVSRSGRVVCNYRYSTEQGTRASSIKEQLWASTEEEEERGKVNPVCGPFKFEIRAWDIDSDSIEQLAQRFNIGKATIRKDIRNYRGVSLYRDRILVLPKTDTARDWLGLDLRRVSKIGTRMSTSQLVGYVAITAKNNEGIKDTSDRERLEENEASKDFKEILRGIVSILEDERSKDRLESKKEPPFRDLFASLSTQPLIENIRTRIAEGADASEVLPMVEEHAAGIEKTVGQIERRLVYYSRLASLGVLAAMLIHEVRNQTLSIGGLVIELRKQVEAGDLTAIFLEKDLDIAENGIISLERLADRFAPLASRALRSRRRDSVLEEIIDDCLAMREKDIEAKKVKVDVQSRTKNIVAVDPGELIAVFINLLDNSLHWLSFVKDRTRRITIKVSHRPNSSRIFVGFHDSGPGVRVGDEERIFYPGVSRKPDGFGMGLTVASEIVAQYGGRMLLIQPGILDGASFGFDLPLSDKEK